MTKKEEIPFEFARPHWCHGEGLPYLKRHLKLDDFYVAAVICRVDPSKKSL